MAYGGFHPFPRRFGSSRGKTIEVTTAALTQGRGTALDSGTGSIAWLDCYVRARALAAQWEAQRRLANQFDPRRCSDFLPRWETIFAIVPPPGSSTSQRRKALAARWKTIGQAPTQQTVTDALKAALPNTFSSLAVLTAATAISHVYTSIAVPGGVTIAADGQWGSSVHTLTVIVTEKAAQSDADFYNEVGTIYPLLNRILPAWVTFDWARDDPSAGIGFWLDAPNGAFSTIPNLDNMRFDV